MYSIFLKEIRSFFSSLIGFVVITVFLVFGGILLWILPDTNILDYGFASMDQFFSIAPWLLLFLIPAVTMKSFSEEIKSGTIEWLFTKPVSLLEIISGKYFAALALAIIAFIPTIIYLFSIYWLSADGAALDVGAIIGSYFGLICISAAFTAIGIFSSSLSDSQIVSFLLAAVLCYVFYSGFEALSRIEAFSGGADYFLEMIGFDFHYRNLNRGVIDLRSVLFFISMVVIFLCATRLSLLKKKV